MLIGLTGHFESGKSTVANYICSKYNFDRLYLAEPTKKICKIIFDFNDEQLYGNLKNIEDERWNITPRKAMQFIGTEFGRKFINNLLPIGEDLWVKLLENKIKTNDNKNVVIDDCRLDNEVEFIKKNNGYIIKIIRDGKYGDNHISETNINNIKPDYIILNNGSIDNLYEKIDLIINEIINN